MGPLVDGLRPHVHAPRLSPGFIQAAFRAGDGALNTVALVNPFLPLFLEIIRRYKKDSGIGTYLSLMMPYAMAFLVMWYALFIFWYLTGWPVGQVFRSGCN